MAETKRYVKRMDVENVGYLMYEVSVPERQDTWLEAIPLDKNKGNVRVAENEKFLRILLENDVRSMAIHAKAQPKAR